MNENFESEDGITRKINMLAIDYFLRRTSTLGWELNQFIVMAIKGIDNSLVPLNAPTEVYVNILGRKITNGVRLWKIGVISMWKRRDWVAIWGMRERSINAKKRLKQEFFCIPNRTDISERPKIVEEKVRVGDWEGDTIISHGSHSALLTLVDRHSK